MSRDPAQELDRLFPQTGELHDEGRFPEAIKLATLAGDLARRSFGEGHPDYALNVSNLAALHQAMGDRAAAVPLYRQAMEILRTVLGEGHPRILPARPAF
jgi:hypothetical protein